MKTFKQFKTELNESKKIKFDTLALVYELENPSLGIYPEEADAKKSGKVKAVARPKSTVNTRKGVIPKLSSFDYSKYGLVSVKAGDPVVFDMDGPSPGGKVYGYSEDNQTFYAADYNTFVKAIGFK